MRNLKLTIEYDGGCFSGFQSQPGKKTVQGELEKVVHKLTGEKVRVKGAGRTDAGVHALNQVVNIKVRSEIDISDIKRALNGLLKGIVVKDIKVVPAAFDSRRSAREREYYYLVYSGEALPVLLSGKVFHCRKALDLSRMKKASRALIGRHDFSSFCLVDKIKKDRCKEIKRVDIGNISVDFLGNRYDLISFRIIASGFLWKMVRFIIGTLLRVGSGKIDAAEIKKIMNLKDNRKAGPVVPACGLYLSRILY